MAGLAQIAFTEKPPKLSLVSNSAGMRTNMIPLNDTRPQYETLKPELLPVVESVMERSWFILGENVAAFEREFADYCGAKFAVGVSNGTDAIHLACAALGIEPGDEVITSPHTATFTAL